MTPGSLLLLWMAFYILCPVLEIGGHFVYLPELYIYLLSLIRLVLFRRPRAQLESVNSQTILKDSRRVTQAHFLYAMFFLATVLLTAWLADQSINNYDGFLLRNIVQVILCLKLFDEELWRLQGTEQLERMVFKVIGVLCIPAVIVYLQKLNVFSMRDVTIALYKPQFFILGGEVFESFRYTSVFKDFFTSAVYFAILASFVFYFSVTTRLSMHYRVMLSFLLIFVYSAQLFVARTSLLMIPLMIGATSLLVIPQGIGSLFKRLLPAAVLVGGIGLLVLQYVMESGLVNTKWALEAAVVLEPGGSSKSSSFIAMQQWYEEFSYHAFGKKYSLLTPNHTYDLTERTAAGRYTDSFYGQELYRYGIYGALSYLVYIVLMLRASLGRNRYISLLVIALAVMNYKGGNTFFMPKNIYLYAFILAVVPYIENRRHRT